MSELHGAPLCPAGHLPHLGGDRRLRRRRPICNVENWRKRSRQPISPQVGEMSGRTEGGVKELRPLPGHYEYIGAAS
ncbi:hypothetical protein CIT25_12830 [Mesorhizobium mediterraneum]|uniref:Lytic murein transglycosylase n=1 Tax=Mesorhizobium mediterraneum TaxID=43617 RepID=A0AB36RCV5_9HYPH|nr:hypothetical protein CIT25_12830 [Mesorhizobium mediterraneum]